MKKHGCVSILSLFVVIILAGPALGHVPYLERKDFTWDSPFVVKKSIQQSIAVYSYLDAEHQGPDGDLDIYQFEIDEPQPFYAEVIVPACPEYELFTPWFALVGPGLPMPEIALPFDLPEGYGAIVMEDDSDIGGRETFYEFFGNKSYYQGPVLDTMLETPGVYYVVYWNPWGESGDYCAVLGDQEIWHLSDIVRALIITPMIRKGKELHTTCE